MFVDNRDCTDITNFSNTVIEPQDKPNTKDCSTCECGKNGECSKFNKGECGIFNNFSLWR